MVLKTNFLAYPIIIKKNKYFDRKKNPNLSKKMEFKQDRYLVEIF